MIQRIFQITLPLATLALAVTLVDAQPPSEVVAAPELPKVISVDQDAGVIDLVAKMVPIEPQWLELIATPPGPKGRQHEAIVTIDAKPSQIHLALVTLGLEPGHPQKNTRHEDRIITEPAAGPSVELFFIYELDGQTHEIPAHQWVIDAETGETLPACKWLFTGSVFRQWQEREYYMADEAGTIASLVNFGDDLIVRQTDTSKDADFQQLQINKEAIPPYGSELVLRIRVPIPPPDQASDQAPTQASDQTLDQAIPTPGAGDSANADGVSSDKSSPAEP